MKIRTDFVTNSSSYSSAEVVIDNPVLMEILIRYKEMGLFSNVEVIKIGDPAFSFSMDDCGAYETSNPGSLSNLMYFLKLLIDDQVVDDNELNQELYDQMWDEITQREDDINQEFISVYWHEREDMQNGAYEESYFKYNQRSGESYEEEKVGIDEDFEY